jgi:hypothetical protein
VCYRFFIYLWQFRFRRVHRIYCKTTFK